jgi:hypothetical protein
MEHKNALGAKGKHGAVKSASQQTTRVHRGFPATGKPEFVRPNPGKFPMEAVGD